MTTLTMMANTRRAQGDEQVNSVVRRNIETLRRRRVEAGEAESLQDRIAGSVSRFAGSMIFVYAHLAILAAWTANTLQWIPGVRPFDPHFLALATTASVEAIFLTAFVLIRQNRAAAVADRRSDLDLQISLLTEHEVTRVLDLCTQIAATLKIETAGDPALDELRRHVAPEHVLSEIEDAEDRPD